MPNTATNAPLNTQENGVSSHSSHPLTLFVQRLEHGQGLELPHYATAGSAGLDLRAALGEEETLVLAPGQRALIPTGLIFHLSPGLEAQIRPRSGLALKHGITCLNTPGTIDSDYRGEVKVLLINLGQEDFSIERGMRIAQTVIAPVTQVNVCAIEPEQKNQNHNQSRGTGGFGSTGHT
ncbi:dUTP diphosphatase [Bartonella tribocorum]|uniref:Deoxyuridine 5'-triphosphate nucleotidohydrolase n=1 Tax=Bartonella tribocorum (strain DSM 28219 / CCUG 45778 / CIP 105476 / IBS 506) TaxID=382640 RepID=A9IYC1_BART1|nr:dUTP diphosphatase [Bartonella tribocorum]CAK02335.1 deoxyuridine 5'-triphosphate nucleotidohydrolase [Bartonella tribocorum CIP 105476]CDO49673.1 deoxyuridine 5'-triphosphate nucleotidohydrolase [Bartonella tribocorum]